MTNKPGVILSVILPVYNAELYLEDCLKSILNQTYKNYEIIIINDGSTDKSSKIIKEYSNYFYNVKIITRENKGLVYSLNQGIRESTGFYIVRMDADDICTKNRFETQVSFMEANSHVDICGSWVNFFNKTLKDETIWKTPKSSNDIELYLLFGSALAHPSVIMKSSIFKIHNEWYNHEYRALEDYELWTRLSGEYCFQNVQAKLLYYRRHNESVTVTEKTVNSDNRLILKNSIRTRYFKKFSNHKLSSERLSFLEVLGDNNKIILKSRISLLANSISLFFLLLYNTTFSKISVFKYFFKLFIKILLK
jgi:glycosyltransferase involved in cell wall biosynthesis